MSLGEIKARILRTFKRPEKADSILDAINYALEYASTRGDFAADLVESSIAISSSDYAQSLVISSTFERFRKIKYLRPSGFSIYLDRTSPDRVFTKQTPNVGIERKNVWYRAGDNLVFKLGTLDSLMYYGYYAYPTLFSDDSDDDDTIWYLDQMSSVIVDFALSRLWDEVGNDSESARAEKRGLRLLQLHVGDKQDG